LKVKITFQIRITHNK